MPRIDVHIVSLRNLSLAEPPGLGDQDRARLERITHERARRSFLGGRQLLQWLFPASMPSLKLRPGGKPEFEEPSSLAISLSHSRYRVACAVLDEGGAAIDIGVDIEREVDRPALFTNLDAVFPPGEVKLLGNVDGSAPRFNALRLWTLKEAVAKAAGCGLAGFDRICLQPPPGGTGATVRSYRYAHWSLGAWHLGLAWEGSASAQVRIRVSSPVSGRSRDVRRTEAQTLSGVAHYEVR